MQPFPDLSAADFEHICLSSDEPEDFAPAPRDAMVTAVLEQATGDCRRVLFLEGDSLGVRIEGGRSDGDESRLELAFLNPRPARPVSRLWWGATFTLALLGAAMELVSRVPVMASQAPWTIIVPAVLACAVLSLGMALHRSFDRLVYYTRHGRIPVLHLSRRRPDPRRVKQFVNALGHAIRRASARRVGPVGHYLRDEMKEHRRLLEQGVCDARDFEAAKARILRAHG
jgi:hypothetical protein